MLYSLTMENLNVRIVMNDQFAQPDFRELAGRMRLESALLHPSVEDLERSYSNGRSAIAVNENGRVLGHSRFIPLMDESLRQRLQLSDSVPQIWEMGSSIVYDDLRNRGFSTEIRLALLEKFRVELTEEKLLVIGTTKTLALRRILEKLRERTSYDFDFCHRERFPMIAPFTCVCSGSFGCGYHLGDNCSQADPNPVVDRYLQAVEIPIIGQGDNLKMFCTMLISSRSLAESTELSLRDRFGSRDNLVSFLKEVNYFE